MFAQKAINHANKQTDKRPDFANLEMIPNLNADLKIMEKLLYN